MDLALLDRMDVEKYLPEIRKALGGKKNELNMHHIHVMENVT